MDEYATLTTTKIVGECMLIQTYGNVAGYNPSYDESRLKQYKLLHIYTTDRIHGSFLFRKAGYGFWFYPLVNVYRTEHHNFSLDTSAYSSIFIGNIGNQHTFTNYFGGCQCTISTGSLSM